MTPDVVVDIGNTRIKWGRCREGVVADSCSLPPGDMSAWTLQAERWQLVGRTSWAVAGVHPARCDQLLAWLRGRGDEVFSLTLASQLPLRVLLEEPDKAGIDRLLDAVAANTRRRAGAPTILIDAGSAITVDLVDETGAFAGGAILPGVRLMAKALHDYTALLPVIEPPRQPPPIPGKGTIAAMELGVFWAAAGGVRALCEQFAARAAVKPDIFLTGGDGPALYKAMPTGTHLWSTMTLEGIRLAAEALP